MSETQLFDKTIVVNSKDNVAVAKTAIGLGTLIGSNGSSLRTIQTVPPGHKVALQAINKGQPVIRYGEIIGIANQNIPAGNTVHNHNMIPDNGNRTVPKSVSPIPVQFLSNEKIPAFKGFQRDWGGVGTRNYVVVLSTVICSSHPTQLIARHFEAQFDDDNFDGVIPITHQEGCGGEKGDDLDQLMRVYNGIMYHPNVAAILLVGLGCEESSVECVQGCHSSLPLQLQKNTKGRIRYLTIQGSGGTSKTVKQGITIVEELVTEARKYHRTEISAAHLFLGLECGGSDAYSGISANPALGHTSDLLVSCGGTTVLPETPEIYGAEHLLMKRASSVKTAQSLWDIIERYKAYAASRGGKLDNNPSPGNIAGGISTIAEKSLGAIRKAGSTPLQAVINYAEKITQPGFIIMDSPGYDTPSISGLVSSGANIVCFTTGRGTPTGNPIVPVLKIATNSQMFKHMEENMDINAGTIVDGTQTLKEVGQKIFQKIISVASGEPTKNELTGHREFAIWRAGAVL